MLSQDEYTRHDGLGLAALVQRGEVAPAELLDAAIARIEAHNPALNAVVRKRYEQARVEAARVDRAAPFAGVPFLVKDLIATLAGEPTGSGNRFLNTLPMPVDSELVRRFRQAGLVIVGRSNTPEFGLTPYTEPRCGGATHNPWSAAHSPGGSSGGSAAAVAGRLVALASGGDGGGSIRVPASCCGLFGFKPSRGSTPAGPALGELWNGLAIEHVITRSVRDSAAMLDATGGADAGAPYAAPVQARPYLREVDADAGRLRVACTPQPLFGRAPPHADCTQAVETTARLLESLGHHVEWAAPELDRERCALDFVSIVAAQTWAEIEQVSALADRRPRADDFEPATFSLGLLGRSMDAAAHVAALNRLQGVARRLAPFFARFDILLTPTLAAPPAPTGSLQPSAHELRQMAVVNALQAAWLLKALGAVEQAADKTFAYMANTALFNITGQPAMSVPLHWNAAGLPIGMQFVGRFGEDATLFRLAGQLERAAPWFERIAPGY